MDASIVIRTKNEAGYIRETLERIDKQEFSGTCEIIIVDSGSTDATLDIVSKYNARVVEIPQVEFTYGRSLNIGASHAKAELVVNLSAHAWPSDDKWLTNLITEFEDNNVAGVYGKQISNGRLNPFEAFLNEQFFGHQKRSFNMNNKKMLKHIHFSNSNSAIRKDIWRRFEFNEEVPYAEDIWWQREVMEAGFSIVYAPDAAVYHTHRTNLYSTYRYSRDCAYAMALMRQKRRSVPLIIYDLAILLAFVPNSVLQNLAYIWRNNHLNHLIVTPFYVVAGWLGWLVGRGKHRIGS